MHAAVLIALLAAIASDLIKAPDVGVEGRARNSRFWALVAVFTGTAAVVDIIGGWLS